MEDRGRKRGEGESEGGSDSEESSKSEEIPSEDACSQCGLPNHPELVREEHVWLCHRLFYHLIVHMTNKNPCPRTFGYFCVWGCFVMIWATRKYFASSCFGCVTVATLPLCRYSTIIFLEISRLNFLVYSIQY